MSGTGQPIGRQLNPSDQHPNQLFQREASRNLTRATANVRKAITRSFTKATTNLVKTKEYVENPLVNRDNQGFDQMDKLRKELMAILTTIETDHHFLNYVERMDLVLSPTERATLRDVIIAKFGEKPREATVTQVKEAINQLESILTDHGFEFDNVLSPQEIRIISDEVSNARQEPTDRMGSQESLVAILSDPEDYGHQDNYHEEGNFMHYAPPNAQFDGNAYNGNQHQQDVYHPQDVRQNNPRVINYEPGRLPILAQQAPCPVCGSGHSLYQCDSPYRKAYCASNELCIFCTSSNHKAFECQLKDLESSPEQSGGRLMTSEIPMRLSTPKNKAEQATSSAKGTTKKIRPTHDDSQDSDEDEWRNPEEREILRSGKGGKGISLYDINVVVPKFKGDPLQYKKFMTSYSDLVLNNPRLNDAMKCSVLEGKLEGVAKSYLIELENPRKAIEATLEALRTAFEEDTSMVSEILKRIRDFQFNQSSINHMAKDILDCKALILRLREHGEDTESPSFVRSLVEKFPEPVWKHLRPLYANRNQPKSDDVLEAFSVYVNDRKFGDRFRQMGKPLVNKEIPKETLMHTTPDSKNHPRNKLKSSRVHKEKFFARPREQKTDQGAPKGVQAPSNNRVESASGRVSQGNQNNERNPGPSKQKPTVQGMPGEVLEPCYKLGRGYDERFIAHTFPLDHSVATKCCFICGPGHSILQCPLSSYEVRQYFRKYGCCHNCAQRNHTTDKCQGFSRCTYCQGMHNTGACPLKEFYRDLKNYPSDAPAPVVNAFFRGPYGGSD